MVLEHLPKEDIMVKALKPLGEYKLSSRQIRFNCPLCEKSGAALNKFNLEIKIQTGVFHCWCCHYKGSIRTLVKEKGLSEFLHLFPKKTNPKKEDEKDPETEKPFALPEHLMSVFKHTATLEYLSKRGVSKAKIKERQIKYCYAGEYKGAIVFPSYNEQGSLTAYICHFPLRKKYFIFKNKNFSCFYSSFIDKISPIILVEGIYDALVVPNAIPLLGTTILKSNADYLSNTNVIYVPDNDVKVSVRKNNIKMLNSICTKVSQYNVPKQYKDVNDVYVAERLVLSNELKQFYSYE